MIRMILFSIFCSMGLFSSAQEVGEIRKVELILIDMPFSGEAIASNFMTTDSSEHPYFDDMTWLDQQLPLYEFFHTYRDSTYEHNLHFDVTMAYIPMEQFEHIRFEGYISTGEIANTWVLKSILRTDQQIEPVQMENQRYEIRKLSKNTNRVSDLPINNEVMCEFYIRLYSVFEQNPEIHFEGFTYQIYDTQNDFYFEASVTGFGPGYFAEENTQTTQELINEFHQFLYSKNMELKDCSMTFEHDFGSTTFQYKDGKMMCE